MMRFRSSPRTNNHHFPRTCLIIILLVILVLTVLFLPKPVQEEAANYPDRHHWFQEDDSLTSNHNYEALSRQSDHHHLPGWYKVLADQESVKGKNGRRIKIGLVDMEGMMMTGEDVITIKFQSVSRNVTWKDLFPEWIDEPEARENDDDQELMIMSNPGGGGVGGGSGSGSGGGGTSVLEGIINKCPDIPMPRFQDYRGLNVVLAKVPCPAEVKINSNRRSYMDVYRLQINLIVANLLVKSSTTSYDDGENGDVYGVFFGSCGPMIELFRCEDLLWHEGNTWIYKPDLRRLKHKILMPVGTCRLPLPLAEPGQELWKAYAFQETFEVRKEAYVTVLHSSEDYVCGAIVLGQSIVQSQTEKDLILLADKSITEESLDALRLAGWKIKNIERIRSSNAQKKAYNEYNYSKLRIWQLTEYDKLMFLDSDLLVLGNLDEYFLYPQLTAVGNCRHLFNSGVLLIEPSKCTFQELMKKTNSVVSYNGGDQGFLNEVFTWWHRFPRKLNFLKDFYNLTTTTTTTTTGDEDEDGALFLLHEYPENTLALHYLGVKPWKCYWDYDCNWDIEENQRFASDSAHRRWWEVYEAMPEKLKPFCGLTKEMEDSLITNREIAKKRNFSDGHWKVKVNDPRSSQRFV